MKKRLIIIFMTTMLATTYVVPAVHADEISDDLNFAAVNEEASYDEYDSDDVLVTDDNDEGVSEEISESASEEASYDYDKGAYEEEEVREDESFDGEIHAADDSFYAYATDSTDTEVNISVDSGVMVGVGVDVYGVASTINWYIDGEEDYACRDYTMCDFMPLEHNFDVRCVLMDEEGHTAEVVFHVFVTGGTESNVEPVESVFEVSTPLTEENIALYHTDSTELFVDVNNTYDSVVSYEWAKNGGVIEGETEYYCEVTEGGLYTCRAYDNMGHEGTVEFRVRGYKDLGAKVTAPTDDNKNGYVTVPYNQDLDNM